MWAKTTPSLQEFQQTAKPLLPLLMLLQLLQHGHASLQDQSYVQQTLCPDMVLSETRRYSILQARSLIHCLSVCSVTEGCRSVVHEPGACHVGYSVAWPNCSNMEPVERVVEGRRRRRHYEQKITCENGGIAVDNQCECTQPYYGERCERIMRDCSDLVSTYKKRNVTIILPTSSPEPFPVTCLHKLGRTFLFRHGLPKVSFNHSYNDYVQGFGNLTDDHWLGLEYIHQITRNNRSYELVFEIKFTNTTSVFLHYNDFRINGSDEEYAISTKPGKNDYDYVKGCLSRVNGAPFSAYDHDRDGSDTVNCGERHGFGWWFSGESCSPGCLLLGRMRGKNPLLWSGKDGDAFWTRDDQNFTISKIWAYLLNL